MEKQINPKHGDQFAKGPNPQPTESEIAQLKQDQILAINADIEYMRLRSEYDKLQIEQYENGILLGRIEPSQVPGLLGLELMRRDIEAQGWLHNWKAGMQEIIQQQEDAKEGKQSSGDNKKATKEETATATTAK